MGFEVQGVAWSKMSLILLRRGKSTEGKLICSLAAFFTSEVLREHAHRDVKRGELGKGGRLMIKFSERFPFETPNCC